MTKTKLDISKENARKFALLLSKAKLYAKVKKESEVYWINNAINLVCQFADSLAYVDVEFSGETIIAYYVDAEGKEYTEEHDSYSEELLLRIIEVIRGEIE